jgi:putative ABC transport system permease protein
MRSFFLAFYLALKEVIRNRGRFFLVALVIALITVLVLFIAALGEGLANANRQYISNIDGQLIVFLEKSDYSISASRLEPNVVKAIRRVDGVAEAGPIYTATTEIVSLPEKLKITMIGVEAERPGMPTLLEGRYFRGGEAREAVMDMSVAERTNLKIGDEIEVRSTQGTEDEFYTLKIVGLVAEQAYFFQPTIFVPAST